MKILKTKNISCSESWDKMNPYEKGKFCLNCNKNVFDFENLTDSEISKILENTEESICARIPKSKVNMPLVPGKNLSKYSRLAVKIVITSSLILFENSYSLNDKTLKIDTEKIVESKTAVFKGEFLREKDESPIVNVKVQLITLNKIFYTYTDTNGEFNLNFPTKFLNKKNVFRISYDEVPEETPPRLEVLSTPDFIITKEKINDEKIIISENTMYYLGMSDMIAIGSEYGVIPLVFYKGEEITYEEYEKNKTKGLYESENYFGDKMAEIICGKEAKNGLILLF
jgi:hypothetical protein